MLRARTVRLEATGIVSYADGERFADGRPGNAGGYRPGADSGRLGDVKYVRAFDCRNYVSSPDPFAPRPVTGKIDWERFEEPCEHKTSYDPWRYFAWRWFWDYGGGTLTDLFSHWVDTIHWVMDDYVPVTAQASGGGISSGRARSASCRNRWTISSAASSTEVAAASAVALGRRGGARAAVVTGAGGSSLRRVRGSSQP